MKMLCAAALLGLFACQAAYAVDGAAAAPRNAKPQAAAKTADAAATGGQAAKPIQMSQQDRMRMCSKQATGKKGAERKAFMKSCLSTKKSS
ncbi:MAG: PsiF family protein [Casimicrobiaceae bacterium]